MNSKSLILTAVVIVVGIVIAFQHLPDNDNDNVSSSHLMKMSYDSSNSQLQSLLKPNGVFMSNPLKIKGESIEKYCQFFSSDEIQNSIQYCTSTELIDSKGKFVGNIHMVGSTDTPFAVLGIIQTDPLMSELDYVKTISSVVVESVVCDCWAEKRPGGLESVSDWIESAKSHHLQAKKITSKSEINNLAEKNLLIELSTNSEGYLWKLIITN